ncbi:MAG: ATP-binding protein [Clostridia bacterium]|nr:ATP-binding protein [Clostridia bacterium]
MGVYLDGPETTAYNLFDPLKVENPDVEADLSERPEGGLGIMLTRTFSDKLSYCVFEGKNRLTVVKRLKADS